ncbi:hypothetical protein Pst134EA_021099 [Puccinia striiformis f. sp. tritici]|nr:hypothetical protein Pst134EA_021099 [Puccinia striiformis f. sp. tritici]KAH9457217.1 hypothetical protein Pst134EA_021099 [Puccinia striiformis f. sp. tritici]
MPPCVACDSRGLKCIRTNTDRACTACRIAKRKCSAINTPLGPPATDHAPLPTTAPPLHPPPPPIPPRPFGRLPPPIPPRPVVASRPKTPPSIPPRPVVASRPKTPPSAPPPQPSVSGLLVPARRSSTRYEKVLRVVVPVRSPSHHRRLSRTPSPFLKNPGPGLPLPSNSFPSGHPTPLAVPRRPSTETPMADREGVKRSSSAKRPPPSPDTVPNRRRVRRHVSPEVARGSSPARRTSRVSIDRSNRRRDRSPLTDRPSKSTGKFAGSREPRRRSPVPSRPSPPRRRFSPPSYSSVGDSPIGETTRDSAPYFAPMPFLADYNNCSRDHHLALRDWFDTRRIIQQQLKIPFDQPVPGSPELRPRPSTRTIESFMTPYLRHPSTRHLGLVPQLEDDGVEDDIRTPVDSPAHDPVSDRPRADGVGHDPVDSVDPSGPSRTSKGKGRAATSSDVDAEGSVDSAHSVRVPFDEGASNIDPPDHLYSKLTPSPPRTKGTLPSHGEPDHATQKLPQERRPGSPLTSVLPDRPRNVHMMVPVGHVEVLLTFMDRYYLESLQHSAIPPVDRRMLYAGFQWGCEGIPSKYRFATPLHAPTLRPYTRRPEVDPASFPNFYRATTPPTPPAPVASTSHLSPRSDAVVGPRTPRK